jgi:hypothetical protein
MCLGWKFPGVGEFWIGRSRIAYLLMEIMNRRRWESLCGHTELGCITKGLLKTKGICAQHVRLSTTFISLMKE